MIQVPLIPCGSIDPRSKFRVWVGSNCIEFTQSGKFLLNPTQINSAPLTLSGHTSPE